MAAKSKVGSSRWWIPDTWNSLHGDRLHWICKVSHLNFIECRCYIQSLLSTCRYEGSEDRELSLPVPKHNGLHHLLVQPSMQFYPPTSCLRPHIPLWPRITHGDSLMCLTAAQLICNRANHSYADHKYYGRFMYPVTCTKHVKRNTDSPTNNIPVSHDSIYTTISCSPNLLFPLKRRITAWIASLTDFLYLQPIVTW